MRRILLILSFSIFSFATYGQIQVDSIINVVKEIRISQGDSIALNYLVSNKHVFDESNTTPSYILLWGSLTSNMWNVNPSQSLTHKYAEFLDFLFSDKQLGNKSFVPSAALFESLWQLSYDFVSILFNAKEFEKALTQSELIHKWFENYPLLRDTKGYARSLLNYCLLLVRDLHRYEEGLALTEEYVDVAKHVFGEKSGEYAVALYNKSICLSVLQKCDEVIKLEANAIEIYEVLSNKDEALLRLMRESYQTTLELISGRTNIQNFDQYNKDSLSLQQCFSFVLAERGKEALPSILNIKKDLFKAVPLDTYKYVATVNLLVTAYLQLGDLSKANIEVENLDKDINISKLSITMRVVLYSSASVIYSGLKDYRKALNYSLLACSLGHKSGNLGLEYIKNLANASVNYMELDDLLFAKWYCDEAVSMYEDKIGHLNEGGSLGLTFLNNKGLVYSKLGQNEIAIDAFKEVVDHFANDTNCKNVWALAANNLSTLYVKQERYKECLSLLENLTTQNSEYKNLFSQNLALVYYIIGDKRVKNATCIYNQSCRENCLDIYNHFTEAELEKYWTRNAREMLCLNNLVADKFKETADVAYDNVLFTKGLSLMSSDLIKQVSYSNNGNLLQLYQIVKGLRQKVTYRWNESDSIGIWKKRLKDNERNLIQSIPDFKETILNSFPSWKNVRDNLKKDEIAIEFTYIPKIEKNNFDDADLYYGALVVSKEDTIPHLITLCESDLIDNIVSAFNNDAHNVDMLYSIGDSCSLYKNIWKPLEKYMKGKSRIFFSPTGSLNSINHMALYMNDGRMFGDSYDLFRLSSTVQLIDLKSDVNQDSYNSAILFGGINYDESVDDMIGSAKSFQKCNNSLQYLVERSENERGRWNILDGTKAEVENVSEVLNLNAIRTQLLEWNDANEETFKNLDSDSISIIHISTHGFFINTTEKFNVNPFMQSLGTYSTKEDNLTRTGLLLAGANNVWTGKFSVSETEDGILTADEISRLDLRGTKLVVLSACETAKGKIDEIDGVLGLQRGFKRAGAKTIVMSLWKVPDTATSILMASFYKYLMQGCDVRSSLRKAQLYLMQQNDSYKNPYYWASFVVLD